MSNTNAFVPFATGGGANVMSAAAWAALAARITGFTSGILPSINLNTALRQSTSVSAMIAQFIADYGSSNVNDDGNIATLESQFLIALAGAQGAGRLLKVTKFTTSGTFTSLAATNSIIIEGVGGGGGSGAVPLTNSSQVSLSYGGNSGAYGKGQYSAGFSGGIAVTIGAAGAAALSGGSSGGNGGATSVGSLMSCPGGAGGAQGGVSALPDNTYPTPSIGSGPTGANIISQAGGRALGGIWTIAGSTPIISYGAASGFGPTGSPGTGADGVYNPFSTAAQGGNPGVAGEVLIYEYA